MSTTAQEPPSTLRREKSFGACCRLSEIQLVGMQRTLCTTAMEPIVSLSCWTVVCVCNITDWMCNDALRRHHPIICLPAWLGCYVCKVLTLRLVATDFFSLRHKQYADPILWFEFIIYVVQILLRFEKFGFRMDLSTISAGSVNRPQAFLIYPVPLIRKPAGLSFSIQWFYQVLHMARVVFVFKEQAPSKRRDVLHVFTWCQSYNLYEI